MTETLGDYAAALALHAAAQYVTDNAKQSCACPVFVSRLLVALKPFVAEGLQDAEWAAADITLGGGSDAQADVAFRAIMRDAGVRAAKSICEVR